MENVTRKQVAEENVPSPKRCSIQNGITKSKTRQRMVKNERNSLRNDELLAICVQENVPYQVKCQRIENCRARRLKRHDLIHENEG